MENICCIYLIKHKLDEEWENVYIGSTDNYKRRHRKHYDTCYNINGRDYNIKLYQYIRTNGDWDNFEFILLEECEKDKLKRLEQSYIDVIKPTLNCQNAFGINKEKLKQKQIRRYIKGRDWRLVKHNCECGGKYTNQSKSRHFKTKRHQAFITKNKI